ncbi:MAG TPA: selenocysteine-specific translation elongation factor [Streptosporangiaceae bacterium]|nr:selenocysteine-specific translation elongation factor [Streptosporangiaceae bacterium]
MHVIATAGHVDHGKSMLVRALTGMEPDRWEAEQRRGMTIDLGFAWMTLPSGERLAFVDVPGHERFITNMLAGAGPAPAVMFVVAADEGWMPQSAEHLAAIDALGVQHGILVITRADLADPGPALRQAGREIAATSLGRAAGPGAGPGGMEAVAVSAVTGQGLPELTAALGRLAARLPQPDPRGGVRLWLDRVFAIKGSGTVVTGTLQAGTVRAGDELTATPAMRPVRVRSVQSLGAPAAQVSGVARVALNLRGVSTRELGRGMALIQAGRWTVTSVIDVRLAPHQHPPAGQEAPAGRERPASGKPPGAMRLPPRLTLHIGAARAVARVRPLGGRFARLSLDHPLPLHVGDRVLLRDPGAAADRAGIRPVYGATVLDVAPPRLRGNGAAAAAERELASWPEPPAAADLLRRHRLLRAGAASAMGLHDLPPPVSGEWLADPAHWQRLRQQLAAAVDAHAARDPLAAGLPVDAARAELGLPDRDLVEALAAWRPGGGAGGLIDASGGYLRRADGGEDEQPEGAGSVTGLGRRRDEADGPRPRGQRPAAAGSGAQASDPRLPAPVADAVRAVLADLADAPFSAPDAERMRELGLDARAAAAAERAGLLCRLPGNVLLAPDAPGRAARILAGLPQPFTAAEARQALGTSRRVVIPLLEWLDREGTTRRLPDDRRTMREPPGLAKPNGER